MFNKRLALVLLIVLCLTIVYMIPVSVEVINGKSVLNSIYKTLMIYVLLISFLKSVTIGEFSIYLWIKYGKIYSRWFSSRPDFVPPGDYKDYLVSFLSEFLSCLDIKINLNDVMNEKFFNSCEEFENFWKACGLNFYKACAIYSLTQIPGRYSTLDDNESCKDWVVYNYKRFKELLP